MRAESYFGTASPSHFLHFSVFSSGEKPSVSLEFSVCIINPLTPPAQNHVNEKRKMLLKMI